MEKKQKIVSGLLIIGVVVGSLVIYANQDFPEPTGDLTDFPDFFTKNDNYFITRIGGVPYIDRDSYRLEIKGLVDNPTSFTLDDLPVELAFDHGLILEDYRNFLEKGEPTPLRHV